jgi:hypothetical protein
MLRLKCARKNYSGSEEGTQSDVNIKEPFSLTRFGKIIGNTVKKLRQDYNDFVTGYTKKADSKDAILEDTELSTFETAVVETSQRLGETHQVIIANNARLQSEVDSSRKWIPRLLAGGLSIATATGVIGYSIGKNYSGHNMATHQTETVIPNLQSEHSGH